MMPRPQFSLVSATKLSPTVVLDRSARGRAAGIVVAVIGFGCGISYLVWFCLLPAHVTSFSDFNHEAWPSYQALGLGHLTQFLRLGPAYVGSLVLRAPFAAVSNAFGGGRRGAYFATSLPCIAAAAMLCAWLSAQPRTRGGIGWASRLSPVLVCFFNPTVIGAILEGHPEEILGAVLCVGAVILAANGRVGWAGVMFGLAVVNKPAASVAIGAVLLAMPPGSRWRGLVAMVVTTTVLLVPITLVRIHGGVSLGSAGTSLGTQTGTIFFAPQLLWWFGEGSWVVQHAHELLVVVCVGCAVIAGLAARGKALTLNDALLLLVLTFLLRAALDPWNNLYYHVPFVLALMTYEVCSGQMPRLTVLASTLIVLVVPVLVIRMSGDLRSMVYAVLVLPVVAGIAARLYLPPRARTRLNPFARRPFRAVAGTGS